MAHSIGTEAFLQPAVIGNIAVRWDGVGAMIQLRGTISKSTGGLNTNEDVTVDDAGDQKLIIDHHHLSRCAAPCVL